MNKTHRFPRTQLLRYRQTAPKAGEEYLLVMARLPAPLVGTEDYALRAVPSRDGVEAFVMTEENLRKKKSDRDLYWKVTDEGDGAVSLYSAAARRYLNLTEQRAVLSRKKQKMKLEACGSLVQISAVEKGQKLYLRAAGRGETASGMIFTSGKDASNTAFGAFERLYGIPAKTAGKPKLTVGTLADIHTDYELQLKPPYLRPSVLRAAKAYRRRYDLDALLVCGDHCSDNGSGIKPARGAEQGKWTYKIFRRTQEKLDDALRGAFRDGKKAKILYVSGNHEYQMGDRQPEGQTYNSANYTEFLPKTIQNVLTEPYPTDLSGPDNLLCYSMELNGVDLLMLCSPLYPVIPNRPHVDRWNPAHTLRQAEWLRDRLREIEAKKGRDAVVLVASHYPMEHGGFSGAPGCPVNFDAYRLMEETMNRFPNLFYFYGHDHAGDYLPAKRRSAEDMYTRSGYAYEQYNDNGRERLKSPDAFNRCRFNSDVLLAEGFHEAYAGSLGFYYTKFFKNNGVKAPSDLTELVTPFSQGCAVEVYDDRVVLTLQNFGTKQGTVLLPSSTYRLDPLVCPLRKTGAPKKKSK